MTQIFELTDFQLKLLRELRLHHWKESVKLRQWANRHMETSPQYMSKEIQRKADLFNAHSNFHICQVQLLNDFFPIGDTAERDAEKDTQYGT